MRDGYGIRVTGTYPRAILPEIVAEVGRFQITMSEGAVVQGGMVCENLEVLGRPFEIQGSVVSTGAVSIGAGDDDALIRGSVIASSSISVRRASSQIGIVRVLGDVGASNLNLERVVVFGNVFGKRVSLSQCLVVGSAYASEELLLSDSICSTFIGGRVETRNRAVLLAHSGIAYDELVVQGEICTAFLHPWREMPDDALVLFTPDDQKRIEMQEDGALPDELILLTCDDRIVGLSADESVPQANAQWLESKLDAIIRLDGDAAHRECRSIDQQLFRLLHLPCRPEKEAASHSGQDTSAEGSRVGYGSQRFRQEPDDA